MVLTREAEDNEPLAHALALRGVKVLNIPCMATRYLVPDYIPKDFHAVTFSSRRGVRGLRKAGLLQKVMGSSPRPLVGVVGKSTGDELRQDGFEPDLQADPANGEVLAQLLLERLEAGKVVLTVRGNLRAGKMDAICERANLVIVPLEVYENQQVLVQKIQPFAGSVAFVASPSAGRRLLLANPWMVGARFVVIGSTTEKELRLRGATRLRKVGAGMDKWIEALCQEYKEAIKEVGRNH